MSLSNKYFVVLIYIIALLFFSYMWHLQVQPFIEDDGAFFLQYAANIAHGSWWKFNVQDTHPIWGASAPLWPIIIAIPIYFGLEPVLSIHAASYICALLFILISALVIQKESNIYIAILFILFISLDGRLQHYFTSGLESPLTALILSLVLAVIFRRVNNGIFIGIILAILSIQKIDLIPAYFLLMFVLVHRYGMNKQILITGILLPLLWYFFAWYYFGAPVPNSFITKALYQANLPVSTSTRWFIDFIMGQTWRGGLFIFLVSIIYLRKQVGFLAVFMGLIVIHIVTYTIKRPFEPYNWYAIPTIICYFYILTLGIFYIITRYTKSKMVLIMIVLMISITYTIDRYKYYVEGANFMVVRANLYDADRAKAGIWVSQHTNKNTTVYTGWGLPAYFSNRYVYDFSYLNRKYEPIDIIAKYHPDILIHQGYITETQNYCYNNILDVHKEYKIVKTFTDTFKDSKANYCFFVAIKNTSILK